MAARLLVLTAIASACATSDSGHKVLRPVTPELRAHQGENPLVHVQLRDSTQGVLDDDGNVIEEAPRPTSFAFVAFKDGTIAFEDLSCGWPGPVTLRRLEPPALESFRAFVLERCPALPQTTSDCSHSGSLEVTCLNGNQRIVSADGCEGQSDEGAPRLAAAREFARRLGITALLDRRPPCDARPTVSSYGEIDVTINRRP
jgi:hypothetical protein